MINNLIVKLKGSSLQAQLLRGGVGSVVIKACHAGLAFLLAVLLARTLGPEDYGIYAFGFALVSLMAIPSQLGLPQLVIRETAKAQVHQQWGLLSGIWRWSTLAVWLFSTVIAVLVCVGVWVFGGDLEDSQRLTILVGLLLVPLVALGNLRSAALKGLRRVVLGQLPESILKPVILMSLVVSLWFLIGAVTPVAVMGLHAMAASLAFLIGAVLLWRVRPDPLKLNPTPQYHTRQWLMSALPLALISGLQMINSQVDIVMLGVIRTPEEVGIYKVVVAAGALVIFGLQAVNMVVAPHFARLYAQGDRERLQNLVTLSSRAIIILAIPVVLMFIFFGETLLSILFGAEFSAGYYALLILAVGQLVNAGVGSVGFLLNMTGHEKESLKAVTIAAMSNVFLNLILVPLYGLEGAALATSITLLIWNLHMYVAVRRILGIDASGLNFKGGRM